jgi:hypothetical protein
VGNIITKTLGIQTVYRSVENGPGLHSDAGQRVCVICMQKTVVCTKNVEYMAQYALLILQSLYMT